LKKYEDLGDTFDLFFLFTGIRLHILQIIKIKPCNFTEIKIKLNEDKYIDTAINNIEHHIKELLKAKLVRRDLNLYGLTTLGSNLIDSTQSMQFIWKNQNYFTDHNIGDLPPFFKLSIGILNKIEIIKGHPKIIRKLIDMYDKAEKFIYNILYEIEGIDEIINLLKVKLENYDSFELKTIFGENSIFDSKRRESLSFFKKYKINGKIEQKMTTKIKISVVVTDKSAFISFPKNGEENPDMHYIISGKDTEFINWCLSYFYHYWKNADEFDEKRLSNIY
jgi:predicted transcriptional regulator